MNAATVAARDARSLGQASDEALLAQISRGNQAALGARWR
jgi:hypothetical protein